MLVYHYLLTAARQLRNRRIHATLNIVGLVSGIVGFLFITLYVTHDLRYDQYHAKKNRIYRLALGRLSENIPRTSVSAGAMPHVLMNSYAGIENVVRFRKLPSLVRHGENVFFEENLFFTDSSLFDIFSFPLLEGRPDKALSAPYSIVLTEDAALRYFGRSKDVVGSLMQIDDVMTFTVTGIIENIPDYSHFQADMFASASTLPLHPQEPVRTYQLTGWYAHYFRNYILLDEKADPVAVAANIREAARQHSDPEQYERYGTNMGIYLQPLTDIHLNPLYGELEPQADKTILYILASVAALVLFLACMNFSNINTALSLSRRKEVGVRKTFGAQRRQLSAQFIGESFVVTFLAFAISIVVGILLLPVFNAFADKNILWTELFNEKCLVTLAIAFVVCGFSGGIYPALVIGRWDVWSILKKNTASGISSLSFRKAVVVFQFTLTIALVAGSVVIVHQVDHMLSKDLGLSSKRVIAIPTHGDPQIHRQLETVMTQLAAVPAVADVTVCELIPGENVFGIIALFEGQEQNQNYRTMSIGYDYLKTFSMSLVAGREFSREVPADTAVDNVLINETLARHLGWTAIEALGKTYDRGGDGEHPGVVIGVVKDFNFNTLRDEAPPMVMSLSPNFYDKLAIRLNSGSMSEAVDDIQRVWQANFPSRPFEFRFADDAVHQQYQSEEKFGKLFIWFSGLAMIIGLLGLGGMLSLELNARTKEVGIRKVLGAPVLHLVSLLTRDAMILIVIAMAAGIPLSFYVCDLWLDQFSYKLDEWRGLILLPSGVLAAVVCLVSAVQTLQHASRNPVETLRNE